jgi:hypothetical protein
VLESTDYYNMQPESRSKVNSFSDSTVASAPRPANRKANDDFKQGVRQQELQNMKYDPKV